MTVKRDVEAVTGHPPRRKTCKKAADGRHVMTETSRDNYAALARVFGAETYVSWVCIHCGKKDLTVETSGGRVTTGGVLTHPAVEVDRARQTLRESVDELTTIGHHKLFLEDGTIRHATTPPLLDQVAAEIAQQSAASAGFNPRSRPPLWLDATQLLAEVDREIHGHHGPTRAERVRTWCNHVASHANPGTIIDAADSARGWVTGCRNLLDPKPKLRLRGQGCPSCAAVKVWDRTDDGADEHHARPALEIDVTRGLCVCLSCEATWAPEVWEHLTTVLAQQRQETLAVDGWDPTIRARSDDEAGRGRMYR